MIETNQTIESLPLSTPQEQIWLHQKLYPELPLYNIGGYLRIDGPLNVRVFQQAVNLIVQEASALRIAIQEENGLPQQSFLTSLRYQVAVVDLTQTEGPDKEANLWMHNEFIKPFQLQETPLFQFALIKLSEEHFLWFMKYHHLIVDGWGISLVVQRIASVYNAIIAEKPPQVQCYPYHAFVMSDLAYLRSERLFQDESYWLQKIQAIPERLFPRKTTIRSNTTIIPSRKRSFQLSRSLYDDLDALARRNGVSLFHAILAALYTYFCKTFDRRELVIGLPTLNRKNAAFKKTIGLFTGVSPARFQYGLDLTFVELMAAISRSLQQDYRHQQFPISRINRKLGLHKTAWFQLFDVVLSFEKHDYNVTFNGYPTRMLMLTNGYEQNSLVIFIRDIHDDGPINVDFDHNLNAIDEAEIDLLINRFEYLLRYVLQHPDRTIDRLDIVPKAERNKLLREFGVGYTDAHTPDLLTKRFEAQVTKTPTDIAAIFMEVSVTYNELNLRSNQLAHYLISLGVGPEACVGILLERSVDLIVCILGVLKAGAAFVPLDRASPKKRLTYMLEDSKVPVLLTMQRFLQGISAIDVTIVCVDLQGAEIGAHRKENPCINVQADNLAYVLYTSGSTGKPKGVMITHVGLANYLNWCIETYDVAGGSGAPIHSSIAFDATITSLFPPLLTGKCIELLSEHDALESLSRLLQTNKRFSLVKITPAHLDILSRLLQVETNTVDIRMMVIGGEALTADQLIFWQQHAPHSRLINEYGPTETVVGSCAYEVPVDMSISANVPIGRPIANTYIHILDNSMALVPIGAPGELYIGGAGLARGYLKKPELTAEKFVPDPFTDRAGARLYKTGDLARFLPDGNIEYLGRLDNLVKVRGYRIELGEIEVVLRQHPNVRDAVVMTYDDPHSRTSLVAYVVPNHMAAKLSIGELRTHGSEVLPDYMVPAAFIFLDALPITPNGKVDRFALPLPQEHVRYSETGYVAPSGVVETAIAAIWADVLGVSPIGIHDDFFELGGDSILGIQVIARAYQVGIHLTLKQVFANTTVASLAAATGSKNIWTDQSSVTGPFPLTPIQQWMFEVEPSMPHHFVQYVDLEVSSNTDPWALRQAVHHVLIHHDALRLRFRSLAGAWQQECSLPDHVVPFAQIDLSDLPLAIQNAAIAAAAARLFHSLNLADGPLLRVTLFYCGSSVPARLLLVIHHLVVDGVSWRWILEDVYSSYQQLVQGKTVSLPAKTSSFQQWGSRLAQYGRSEAIAAEEKYWLDQAWSKDQEPLGELITNDGSNLINSAEQIVATLGSNQTRGLLRVAPAVYNTQINNLLLTALLQAFAFVNGTAHLHVDVEGHGRAATFDDIDVSRTVGWFTTVYPVNLESLDPSDVPLTLQTIKQTLQQVPNDGIGYGALRYGDPDPQTLTRLKSLPQAQVKFNYLGQFDQLKQAMPDWGLPSSSPSHITILGMSRDPRGRRSHLLEVDSLVVDRQLHMIWTFSRHCHQAKMIEQLAKNMVVAIERLLSHCYSVGSQRYSPADFPLANLTEQSFERLAEMMSQADTQRDKEQ